MPDRFDSPSALLAFAVDTAEALRAAGLVGLGRELEAAARFPASTGSEWMAELGWAASRMSEDARVPAPIRARLRRICTAW